MSNTPRRVDKSKWGDGPWQHEPDRVDFVHAGFACLMLRHPDLGHWCGYCGVPKEHPAYGKDYDSVDVEFHGGLTYSGQCNDAICHTPQPGMPDDVWWLGGDFAHFMDLSPGMLAITPRFHRSLYQYRDLAHVKAEVKRLANQLRALAKARGEQ